MDLEYDNIFEAVTEDKAEASDLQTRSDLMNVIRDIIGAKGWRQAEAAEQMGITQPRVNDLVNGRIEKFSIDKLMNCLYQVGFRFKPAFVDSQLTMTVSEFLTFKEPNGVIKQVPVHKLVFKERDCTQTGTTFQIMEMGMLETDPENATSVSQVTEKDYRRYRRDYPNSPVIRITD